MALDPPRHAPPRLLQLLPGLALLAVLAASAADAQPPKDAGQASAELTELRARMGELQRQLEAARTQESAYSREVREVEQRIGRLNRDLRALQAQLREGEQHLAALELEYRTANADLERERGLLARQLRAAYLLGRQEQVKLLLNQEDPARLGRTLVYYRYLSQARMERIGRVESLLQQLDAVQQAIAAQRGELVQREAQRSAEIEELAAERLRREGLLAKLKEEIRAQGGHLAKMQKDEKRLQGLVDELQRALAQVAPPAAGRQPFAKLKRKLPWPVAGKLAANFGDRREVGTLRWRGAFIAAPANLDVRAVAHGRVVFADWLRGFGLLVIIDHGDGYMTLYGHNQSLFKQVGDRVDAGEVVASVGDTGGMARPGLYFELRHKGEPINPKGWLVAGPGPAQAAR